LLPDVEYTCDAVVVMDKGAIATAGPIAALKQPRGRVYELRVKTATGDVESFLERLRAAGLECHATDEDVMRVFVPGEGGARELFALADYAQRKRWSAEELLRSETQKREQALRRKEGASRRSERT
jgi:ABC-type multidrug transport system ATPase subunit